MKDIKMPLTTVLQSGKLVEHIERASGQGSELAKHGRSDVMRMLEKVKETLSKELKRNSPGMRDIWTPLMWEALVDGTSMDSLERYVLCEVKAYLLDVCPEIYTDLTRIVMVHQAGARAYRESVAVTPWE